MPCVLPSPGEGRMEDENCAPGTGGSQGLGAHGRGAGGRCRCMEDEQADGWDGAGKLGMGEMS